MEHTHEHCLNKSNNVELGIEPWHLTPLLGPCASQSWIRQHWEHLDRGQHASGGFSGQSLVNSRSYGKMTFVHRLEGLTAFFALPRANPASIKKWNQSSIGYSLAEQYYSLFLYTHRIFSLSVWILFSFSDGSWTWMCLKIGHAKITWLTRIFFHEQLHFYRILNASSCCIPNVLWFLLPPRVVFATGENVDSMRQQGMGPFEGFVTSPWRVIDGRFWSSPIV